MKNILHKLNSLPIAAKLGMAILATSLLPMIGTAYYNLNGSLAAVNRTEVRNLEQLATNIAGQVSQIIVDYRNLASYVANQDELAQLLANPGKTAAREDALGKFNTLVATHPDVELLMAMDAEGNVLTSSDPELVGKNFKFRDYFREAIQGRSYATSIIVGAVAGNAGMFFAAPVRLPNGVAKGVAVIKLKSEAIGQIVERGARGGPSAFIIDSDGVIIYHRDRNQRYRSLTPLSDALQKRIAEDKRFRLERIETVGLDSLGKAMIGAREAGSLRYSAHGEREIAGFAPVAAHTWVVGVNEPEEVFAAPLRELFMNTATSLIAVGIGVVILAGILARQLVRPLTTLTTCAEAVERGDYANAVAKVDSNDEVGRLATTFNGMLVGIRDREKVRDVFGRMVSPEVREKLLAGTLSLGGETARVSVLFSDIRGFSTLSEQMSAQEVVAFLNEYLTEMSLAARNWGGYINNFIGDAIVVIFGAPMAQPDIEWRAVAASLEMRDRLRAFNLRRQSQGLPPIHNGVGISTGEVVAGQMGSLDRFLYTVIGDAVNVAARLESLTKDFPDYPILINKATYEAVANRPELKVASLGPHEVKGRMEKVEVYGVAYSDR